MFAPLKTPPSLICSVAASKIFMNDTGPEVNPELSIKSPFGLNFEKLKPVPAPVLWIKAVSCNVLNIELMSSSIGSTKQAANCCNFLPALNKVGEFGKKSNEPIKL